jgi:hypothetical protein
MPIILPSNSISAGGYEVANSVRMNRASTDYLKRTPSAGNRRTWTFSTWVKRSSLTGNQDLITSGTASAVVSYIYFYSANGIFAFEEYVGGYQINIKSNAYLKDFSSWYNLIIAVDTTQGTASNRIKMYINGNQVTSLSASTYPSQNFECNINSNTLHNIGCEQNGTNCIDGYLAETVFIDGLQLGADSFGEFDEDSGIWKPIDVSGLTFGSQGWYLDYEDSSALGNDVSGNNNDWTVNNLTAIDQSTDTCTNNAPTFNPLFLSDGTAAFSEGSLKLVSSGTGGGGLSTFGVSSGKWYIEVKQTAVNEPLGNGESLICVVGDPAATKGTIDNYEGRAFAYGIRNHNGTKFANTSGSTSWHGNWTAGDIISIALDMDNNNVYFAKNGQYANGSGSWNQAFTGSPAAIALSTDKTFYFVGAGHAHSSATETFELNTLSPSFSISSSNTDANNLGNFEYSVPSGYFALCTKNLAENS